MKPHYLQSKNKITLTVLDGSHIENLVQISRDERIWKFATHDFSNEKIFRKKWIQKAFDEIKENKRICFVVLLDGKIIGSSSLYQLDSDNKKCSMGYTWFSPEYWGSYVNPTVKFILLNYVFNTLNFNRVEFCVDSMNLPSRQSLAKFKIQEEGLLRNHMILSNGRIRHSVIFSVIKEEWPLVEIMNRVN